MNNLSNIAPKSPTYGKRRWIFDTGATDHMVCSSQFFTTSSPIIIVNRYVHPNHTLTQVAHIGTMHFHNSLILNNVLFVPSFELNLIFVTKLNQTFYYHANFTNNLCFLKDENPGKTIGTRIYEAGFYKLDTSKFFGCSLFSTMVTSTNPHLWHQRLGPPSNKEKWFSC